MKIRRKEKQVGIRVSAEQHSALREIAEQEGYDSVSELVREMIRKKLQQRGKKKKPYRIFPH